MYWVVYFSFLVYHDMDHSEPYQLSDFQVISTLGKGGFGKAFLALRKVDGIEVCLKAINLDEGISKHDIEREAKILSALNNQYVIKYYGSFVESGRFFIVMEYAKEGSLEDLIQV